MPDIPKLSRRRFLAGVGAAGAATLALDSAATAEPVALTAAQSTMVLRVAEVGAVFPVPFPDFNEQGPAVHRATPARLGAAQSRTSVTRLAAVQAGTEDLIAAGLANVGQPALLDGIGRVAVAGTADERQRLTAVAALAVATVSTHFDPNSDAAAQLWLGGLGRLHSRGNLPTLAMGRGLR